MADRFMVRRALGGLLAGSQPIVHGLVGEAGLGVVVRHQLGLGLDGLGEP